jgi:transcriptional regulator with XRE-family HTH domain
MTIYEKVTALREKQGISQSELERKADLSKGTITNWKNRKPNMTSLEKVAKALGCDVTYFMTDDGTSTYYLNEETAKLAQEMFEDEDMRSLFSMKQKMTPERFSMHVKHMKELFEQETNTD